MLASLRNSQPGYATALSLGSCAGPKASRLGEIRGGHGGFTSGDEFKHDWHVGGI